MTVVDVVSLDLRSNAKRIGNCGRKRAYDGELPSKKLKKAAHAPQCYQLFAISRGLQDIGDYIVDPHKGRKRFLPWCGEIDASRAD